MKPEFVTTRIQYYRPILLEEKLVEETAEAVIPENCPDLTEAIFACGTVFLRSSDHSNGQISISAGVSAMALAQPEERKKPEIVEAYIPITLRVQKPEGKEADENHVEAQIRKIESVLVNPRKLLIRVTVAFTICAYEKVEETHISDGEDPNLQMLKKTAPVRLVTAMGEKRYTVEDTVKLEGVRDARELAGVQLEILHTDCRLTGTRAVLRGVVRLRALCWEEERGLCPGTAELPFSQYIDVGDCNEEDELMLTSCIGGADVELGSDGESLNVTVQLETAAKVYGRMEIPYVEDLYSTRDNCQPEFRETLYQSLLDRQSFPVSSYTKIDALEGKILFYSCLWGQPETSRDGEQVALEIPVTVYALTETEQGYRGSRETLRMQTVTRAAPSCGFTASMDELRCTGSMGSSQLMVEGVVQVVTACQSTLREVVDAELLPVENREKGPGLVMRRPKAGETLWELAKAGKTTMAAIMAANNLEEAVLGDGFLLIPSGR